MSPCLSDAPVADDGRGRIGEGGWLPPRGRLNLAGLAHRLTPRSLRSKVTAY